MPCSPELGLIGQTQTHGGERIKIWPKVLQACFTMKMGRLGGGRWVVGNVEG